MAKALAEVALELKEPMHPKYAWVLAGLPADFYPGDEHYPETMAQITAWEDAMAAKRASASASPDDAASS